MSRRIASYTGAALAVALGFSSGAGASGFALIEHSAQGMGNAFAGGAAGAEDASTVFFNPAGMSRLEGANVQAVGHIINPSFEFTDGGSFQATPAGAAPLLPGADRTQDGGTLALVPNFYYTRKVGTGWTFGLGVNTPFGLKTEYDRNWVGRYQAVESEIVSFNVNPAVSYQFTPRLSIGFGLNIMYLEAKLTNAVDFDAVCASTGAAVAAAAGVPAPAIPATVAATCAGAAGSGANDGFVKNEADDIGFGANVGVLYQVTDHTRVGVAYRSEVKHDLEGDADFTVPQTLTTGGLLGGATQGTINTLFADTTAAASLDTPATFSASVYHRVHPKFGLMGDVTHTGWDSVQELRIKFGTPGAPDGVETLSWENTWRYSVGVSYYHNDKLTVRGGWAYDESPIPNAATRTARLPDNDRMWVSFGASYRATDRLSADVGYSHLFVDDTNIRRAGSTGNVLVGTYESSVDIFSAQARYRW